MTQVVYNTTSGAVATGGGSTDLHDLNNPNPGPMLVRHYADGIAMVNAGILVDGTNVQLKGAIGVGSLGGFTSNEANSLANGWFVYLRGPKMSATLTITDTSTAGSGPPELLVEGVDLVVGKAWTLFTFGHTGVASDPQRLLACDDYFRRGALTVCIE